MLAVKILVEPVVEEQPHKMKTAPNTFQGTWIACCVSQNGFSHAYRYSGFVSDRIERPFRTFLVYQTYIILAIWRTYGVLYIMGLCRVEEQIRFCAWHRILFSEIWHICWILVQRMFDTYCVFFLFISKTVKFYKQNRRLNVVFKLAMYLLVVRLDLAGLVFEISLFFYDKGFIKKDFVWCVFLNFLCFWN